MSERLVIVIPAYNEEETIESVLKEWYKIVELHHGEGRSRLLVINDGSRDRTEQILEAFAREHPLFRYVTQKNAGHGAAIWTGYRIALKMKADYIFQTDSDGQTTVSDFPAFWSRRRQADVVAGQRVTREDGRDRMIVSRVLALLLRIVFRVTVEDANCPYRLMSRSALQDAMRMVPRQYHLTNVLLSVAFRKQKKEVCLIPIHFRKRQGGTNSIHIRNIIKIGWRSLREFVKLEREYRIRFGGDN
ncbi:MAG: glycosyltransferase family 2 protein [Lachnospiraceae bacterium]|nr:glycosyltransferase family 2 protein [Lachnospiraceae bacterium]